MNKLYLIIGLFLFSAGLPAQKLLPNDEAPEISLPSPDGQIISLSSLKGKLVLIDFWASWCGPCVKEQPELKKLYEKFSASGDFEILGVSLDRKKENWENAIQKFEINWPQISDLKYWMSPVTEIYDINDLPYNVLVDKAGKMIAFDLHAQELEDFIADYLKMH